MRIFIIALAIVLSLSGCMAVQTKSKNTEPIVLETLRGDVKIPTSGSLSNYKMTNTSKQLKKAAKKIKSHLESPDEVKQAIAAIAQELYNEAAVNLDLTLRIAKRTSSGLDHERIKNVSDIVEILISLFKAQPPPNKYVSTKIDTTETNVTLHYKSTNDYKKKRGGWESYTYKQKMHIGYYTFRVLPCAAERDGYMEQMLILDEPFKKRIQPTCGL